MELVIDASVAVEVLLRSRLGEHLSSRLEGSDLIAPDLLDVEVLAVVRRLRRDGELSEERALAMIEDLTAWPIRRVPGRELVKQAWAFRDHATAYDALYLAAAYFAGTVLLTADGPLSRAPAPGVIVENVRVG